MRESREKERKRERGREKERRREGEKERRREGEKDAGNHDAGDVRERKQPNSCPAALCASGTKFWLPTTYLPLHPASIHWREAVGSHSWGCKVETAQEGEREKGREEVEGERERGVYWPGQPQRPRR